MNVSDDLVFQDYQHFIQFVYDIILPLEPHSFVGHSRFHKKLMYYACEPLTAMAAPRGSLKSTIFAKYRALHRLVDPHPETVPSGMVDILIISETSKIACEHLSWIKWHLVNNDKLIQKYGRLVDPGKGKFNEDEVQLLNGNRVMALGSEGQIRGWHPTDIIVDDLESVKNMGTEDGLAKLKDWFYRSLMGTMLPETRLAVIGTVISRSSLLTELVGKEGFRSKIWKALEGETEQTYKSIWPERWPIEYLIKRKKQLGTHRFNAEYQNEPIGIGEPIIWDEWIKRFNEHQVTQQPIRRYITCDPAFTQERWGNYSAIIVLDEMPDGSLYEKLAWRRKVPMPELVKVLCHFYHHFSSNCPEIRFGIEEVAAQKSIRQSILEIDPAVGAVIQPLKPDKDKVRRLADVSRYFESGIVYLKTETLIDELLAFPTGDKDRVDALVYGLKLYEKEHPLLNDKSVVAINPTLHLSQTELELYIERNMQGVPDHFISPELMKNFQEAQVINQFFEDF